jgi:long-chain acyl-CoA synthetase
LIEEHADVRPYVWNPWLTAEIEPDRVAVVRGGSACSFAELVRWADAIRGGLIGREVPDGSVISTDVPTGPAFFALALAALRGGYALFPVDPELFDSTAGARLLSSMGAVLHVAEAGSDTLQLPCPAVELAELTELAEPAELADGATANAVDGARAGYLTYATSGTTGEPQAVARARPPRSYRGVAVEERYAAGREFGPHVMANSAYHLGTLGPALYALQAGSGIVVMDSWSPDTFAETVDRYAADSAMLSPDLLTDLTEHGRAPKHPLRAVFHAGEACPPTVKESAITLLGPVLHEYYGTSRSILTEITTPEWMRHRGSVGRPRPGIGIQIRAREGGAVAPGQVGEICAVLRSADGLSGDAELLRTGDLGFLDDDGYLYITGRAEDGGSEASVRLEYEIRLLPGVTDVAVLNLDAPVCFVETGQGRGPDLEWEILAEAERLGVPGLRVKLLPRGTLPRTPSGKIHRAALRT